MDKDRKRLVDDEERIRGYERLTVMLLIIGAIMAAGMWLTM